MQTDDDVVHCDVCAKASRGHVLASAMGPVSFAYCQECQIRGAEPYGAVAMRIFVMGGQEGDLDELRDVVTWNDGRYVGLASVLENYVALEPDIRAAFSGAFDD